MTARKPKPRKAAMRKGSGPTLSARVAIIEAAREYDVEFLDEIKKRLDALETRKHFRDASHDEPVSNANETIGGVFQSNPPRTEIFEWNRTPSEAVGEHFRIVGDAPRMPWWRRFLTFMRSP